MKEVNLQGGFRLRGRRRLPHRCLAQAGSMGRPASPAAAEAPGSPG